MVPVAGSRHATTTPPVMLAVAGLDAAAICAEPRLRQQRRAVMCGQKLSEKHVSAASHISVPRHDHGVVRVRHHREMCGPLSGARRPLAHRQTHSRSDDAAHKHTRSLIVSSGDPRDVRPLARVDERCRNARRAGLSARRWLTDTSRGPLCPATSRTSPSGAHVAVACNPREGTVIGCCFLPAFHGFSARGPRSVGSRPLDPHLRRLCADRCHRP